MPDSSASAAAAVLITGVYGTGKSTVTEEIASLLEVRDVPYAAIDLDWLIWANVAGGHGPEALRVMLQNLAAVVANYRAAGITRYVAAGWVEGPAEVDGIREAIGMPLAVVRLVAPIDVIERRLTPSPTALRHEDLESARRELARPEPRVAGDLVVPSDRPITDVATEILSWLGW